MVDDQVFGRHITEPIPGKNVQHCNLLNLLFWQADFSVHPVQIFKLNILF